MPVSIHGRPGRIDCCIIKGSAPLLLSRNTMKSLRAVLDFEAETISIGGSQPRSLQKNAAGQFILNVMDNEEALMCEETSGEENSPGGDALTLVEDVEHCAVSDGVEHCAVSDGVEHCTLVDGIHCTLVDHCEHCTLVGSCEHCALVAGPERVLTKREQRCLLAHREAWEKNQSTVAVAELFSPPRFSAELEKRGEKGLAFDIKQGWDLTHPKVQKTVDQQLEETKPELLVCCPERKHWGGWYRLNRRKLPMEQQLRNQRAARTQADFCAQQIRKQLKRGGRVLLEHPWSSDLWRYPPIKKLLQNGQLTVRKANMCAYGLQDADSGQPMLKATGLAVSREDMADLALPCPGHQSHHLIEGHTGDGVNRSARAAEVEVHSSAAVSLLMHSGVSDENAQTK